VHTTLQELSSADEASRFWLANRKTSVDGQGLTGDAFWSSELHREWIRFVVGSCGHRQTNHNPDSCIEFERRQHDQRVISRVYLTRLVFALSAALIASSPIETANTFDQAKLSQSFNALKICNTSSLLFPTARRSAYGRHRVPG
jgi:hypothetical protein